MVSLSVLTVTLCPAFLIAIADVNPPMPPPMTTTDKLFGGIASIPRAHLPTSKARCVVAISVLPCSRRALMGVGASVGCAGRRRKLRDQLNRCNGIYNEPVSQWHAIAIKVTSQLTCPRIPDLHACSKLACHTDARRTRTLARGSIESRWGRTVLISSFRHKYLGEGDLGNT